MEKLLVEFVVRSTLLALITAAGLFVLRIRAARVRHRVWTGVMVTMLVLPIWSVWGPKVVLHVLTPPGSGVISTQVSAFADTGVNIAPARPAFWTAETMTIALWLIGVAVLFTRLATGTIRTNRLRRLADAGLVTPVTVGWLRPSIILPTSWKEWPAGQLQAVMAHEEEHARRRDPLVQWMALLNRAVFWFHPLAWWLETRLAGLSEEACDDAVLMGGLDPMEYSECLLGLARAVRQAGARVEVVGMAMPGTFLPERIRRIAGGVKVQKTSGKRLAVVAAFCGAVSAVCVGGSIGYAAVATSGSTPAAVRAEPVRKVHKPILMAQAATPGSSIRGIVVDPANLVVPGATVTLTNTDTGAILTAATNEQGEYRFTGFPVGAYSLSVRVPGFKPLTQTGIRVRERENRNTGKMPLQLGSVVESVSIVGSRNAPVPFIGTLGPMTTIPGSIAPVATPPPAPVLPAGTGGHVTPVNLLRLVRPSYPVDLQRAGTAGTVRLEAVISKEGIPQSPRVISSPDPALTRAALEAAEQWRYRPSALNGQPIEVVSTIDMNFSLKD